MADAEAWRRQRAEELGLAGNSPWMNRAPRPALRQVAVDASSEPEAESKPDPEIEPDLIAATAPIDPVPAEPQPGEVAPAPALVVAPPSIDPAPVRPGYQRPGRVPMLAVLAIVGGLALAALFGWWLRGKAMPMPAALPAAVAVVAPSATSASARPPAVVAAEPAARPARLPRLTEQSVPVEPAQAASPRRKDAATRRVPAAAPPRVPDAAQPRRIDPRVATSPGAKPTSARASTPSFNCRRAGSDVTRMICNDRRLAALDNRMARAYRLAVSRVDRPLERRIDSDQAIFLNERARCTGFDCIARAYRIRIEELDSVE